jgi:hypothetical protein
MRRYSFFLVIAVMVLAAAASTLILRRATATGLPPLIVFTAQLMPSNEITPVTNKDASGVGEAVVTLHVTRDSSGAVTTASADFGIFALNLQGSQSIIFSHISQAAAGTLGPVVVDSGYPLAPLSPLRPGARQFTGRDLVYRRISPRA